MRVRRMLLVCSLAVLAACHYSTRLDRVRTAAPVQGVDVAVMPVGYVSFQVMIDNHLPEAVRVLWDESSYVDTDGATRGRLLRGETRRIHDDREQPATPIAPGASLTQWCVPEALSERIEAGPVLKPATPGAGKFYVVIETPAGKQTWVGAVTFTGGPLLASDGTDARRACMGYESKSDGDRTECFPSMEGCVGYARQLRAHPDQYRIKVDCASPR